MYMGSTQQESESQQPFNNSFFTENVATSDWALRPTKIKTYNAEQKRTSNGAAHHLDVNQLASASFQSQAHSEEAGGDLDLDRTRATQSTSPISSQSLALSVSPAAMFLSTFSPPTVSPPPDAEGQVVSGYTLGSVIGYGGFSIIRRAFSVSGGVVAVKIVRHSDLSRQGNVALARKRIQHEATVWSTLSHEHILPLFSAIHTSYADYFVTLFCPAGSLFDILKRDGRPALPQDEAGMMFRQVVRGLRYLHEIVMSVHRDIKLENVLVDEMGVCRIGDFGMTRKIGELDEDEDELKRELEQHYQEPLHTGSGLHRAASLAVPSSKGQGRTSLQVQLSVTRHNGTRHRNSTSSAHPTHSTHIFQPGSLPYASPELLLPPTSGPLLPHPAQDIWALGILLYALLTGNLPFVDTFEPRLQMKILNGVYEVPTDIGRGAERVLKGCLDSSVASRWTIEMVDEVAWGVGWGAEGDDVTPDNAGEEFETPSIKSSTSATPSRSHLLLPEGPILENPDWLKEEPRSWPSLEVASRRSSSRIKRSLSRAPVPFDRSSSGRSMDRNMSWHSRAPSPSFSVLNSSILSTGARSGSSTCCSPLCESALYTSPPSSLERGRRLDKTHTHCASDSPSPSVVPTTPVETGARFSVPLEVLEAETGRELSRGRKGFGRDLRALRREHLYSAEGDPASELDILRATADCAPQNTLHSKRSSSVGDKLFPALAAAQNQGDRNFVGWRNENQSKSPFEEARNTTLFWPHNFPGSSHHTPEPPLAGESGPRRLGGLRRARSFSGSGCLAPSKPMLTPACMARSRSVWPEPRNQFCLHPSNDLSLWKI